jgi:hypothetical protein
VVDDLTWLALHQLLHQCGGVRERYERLGIEPELSLAFSVRSGPGTYAILLGSGVSRAAGVPTGWEVTLRDSFKTTEFG